MKATTTTTSYKVKNYSFEITTETCTDGYILCYTRFQGNIIRKKYLYYTKAVAKQLFKEHLETIGTSEYAY